MSTFPSTCSRVALNTKTSKGLVLAADFRILSPLHIHRLKAIPNCHAAGNTGVDSVGLRRNGEEEMGLVSSKGEKAGAAIVHFPFCIDCVMQSLKASSVL